MPSLSAKHADVNSQSYSQDKPNRRFDLEWSSYSIWQHSRASWCVQRSMQVILDKVLHANDAYIFAESAMCMAPQGA